MENSANIIEQQKNVLQIEAMATEAITAAVRSLLPVKQILKDYMGDDQEEIEDEVIVPASEPVSAPSSELVPAPAAEEEVKEPEKVTEVAPEVKEAAPTVPAPTGPAVINIDTEEASVKFSDYDDVVGDGDPELRFAPKGDDDDDFTPSDGIISVNETSAKPMDTLDVEDLEAPAPAPKSAFSESIDAEDVEVLN
jgi:hypothetical protein